MVQQIINILTIIIISSVSLLVAILSLTGLLWVASRLGMAISDRSLAFGPDTIRVIAQGRKPGWTLEVYGDRVVIFRHPGHWSGAAPEPRSRLRGGVWLLDDPDENNWQVGRRIGKAQLALLMQRATTFAPEDAS